MVDLLIFARTLWMNKVVFHDLLDNLAILKALFSYLLEQFRNIVDICRALILSGKSFKLENRIKIHNVLLPEIVASQHRG